MKRVFYFTAFHSVILLTITGPAISETNLKPSIKNFFRGDLSIPKHDSIVMNSFRPDIIVGSVTLSGVDWSNYYNLSFPNLVEITGCLTVSSIVNLESLSGVFPMLRVIRGERLSMGSSVIIFNVPHLKNIGLFNLRRIVRGSFYIHGTPLLCYVESIDWSAVLGSNRLERHDIKAGCKDVCPSEDARTKTSCPIRTNGHNNNNNDNKLLCWNEHYCQSLETCQENCSVTEKEEEEEEAVERGCYRDETSGRRECCHVECLSGCWGRSNEDCYSCKNYRNLTSCVHVCPPDTYALDHICYSADKCRSAPPQGRWKPVGSSCHYGCPTNYKEDGSSGDCIPCPKEGCWRECSGPIVDDLHSASLYEGCNVLKGNLQVNFNYVSKEGESLMAGHLSQLRHVTGFVDVSGSFGLTSLNFLRSLEVIGGQWLVDGEYSLVVTDNYNLRELIDKEDNKTSRLKIARGRVYLKNNPKLCSIDIKQFVDRLNQTSNSPNVTEYQDPNSLYCIESTKNFSLSVEATKHDHVLLRWRNFIEDDGLLRTYVAWIVHYQPIFKDECQVDDIHYSCESKWSSVEILPSFGRAAANHDPPSPVPPHNHNNNDDHNNDDNSNDEINDQSGHYASVDGSWQFARLVGLAANQRYAAFVRIVFLGGPQRRGLYSDTVCFTTDVTKPSPVRALRLKSVDHKRARVAWLPPQHKRGRVDLYAVVWFHSALDADAVVADVNYCANADSFHARLQRYELQFGSSRDENAASNSMEAKPHAASEATNQSNPHYNNNQVQQQQQQQQQRRIATSTATSVDPSVGASDGDCCMCPSDNREADDSGGFLDFIERLNADIERQQQQQKQRWLHHSGCQPPFSIVQEYLMSLENLTWPSCSVSVDHLDNLTDAKRKHNSKQQIELVKGTSTEMELENLMHFQEYVVQIEACNVNGQKLLVCSSPSVLLFQTWPSDEADSIDGGSLKAAILESNRTQPSLDDDDDNSNLDDVTTTSSSSSISGSNNNNRNRESSKNVSFEWRAPAKVNGVLVAYWIKIENVDESTTTTATNMASPSLMICIDPKEHRHREMMEAVDFRLQLLPGNYTWKVKVVSLAGNGTWSEQGHMFVPGDAGGETAGSSISFATTLVVAVVLVILLLSLVSISSRCYHAKQAKMHEAYLKISLNPNYMELGKWEIPKDKIEIGDVIGNGQFGSVHRGLLSVDSTETPVAVKVVKESGWSLSGIQFLQEISVMREFDSYHVVKLIGISYKDKPYFLVMELLEFGDLLTFLRRYRQETLPSQQSHSDGTFNLKTPSDHHHHHQQDGDDDKNKEDKMSRISPTTSALREHLDDNVLLGMAVEVADGMAYLAYRGFVHRDLAARNCLVDSKLVVKISDFGLACTQETAACRGVEGGPAKINDCIPIRWMPPEALKAPAFSEKSDVWAYGILVWEMFTRGTRPYVGLSNGEVKKFVLGGGRLDMPPRCPVVAAAIMDSCWNAKPKARPSFVEIVRTALEFAKPDFMAASYFGELNGLTK